jgi:hypothetical protein
MPIVQPNRNSEVVHMPMTTSVPHARAPVTIRLAGPGDAPALRRLAALDSAEPLSGPALVAEVGDEIWAAVSLEDTGAVADPFRPSGELVALLVARARQLHVAAGAPRRRRRPFAVRPRRARPAT